MAMPCASAGLVGVGAGGLQHRQGGEAGPDGVILVGDGCAEHCHQAVAHQSADRPLVAMDGLHHPLDGAVEEPLGVLGIAVADQLGRADHVGEEDGDLLALAGQGVAAGQDLLGQVARGVALRRNHHGRRNQISRDDRDRQGLATLVAESTGRWVEVATGRAGSTESSSAAIAEPGVRRIVGATG